MKKTFLFIVFCCATALHSIAAPVWANRWNVLEFRYNFATNDLDELTTYIYRLVGDTSIAANTYSKMVHYPSSEPQKQEYVCAMRTTEDGKVYVYHDNTEYLLYDFDVNIGDVRYTFGGPNTILYSPLCKDSIVNISTLANGRKKIEVERFDGECQSLQTWIEGVGSTTGIIYPGTCAAGSFGYVLLCAYHDDECIYTTDSSEFSIYGCEYNQTETAVSDTQADSCAATKWIKNGNILIYRNGKTYNIVGIEM